MNTDHMPRMPVRTPGTQRGVAALTVTLMLSLALVLATLFVNRSLVFEQRSAGNQARSTQAFEAAEAGVQWAIARLADGRGLDTDCAATADLAAGSFRARHLRFSPVDSTYTPIRWDQAGVATALQPACVRGADGGWRCSCPAHGWPQPAAGAGAGPAPAFILQFLPSDSPGTVRVASTGCTAFDGPCRPGSGRRVDASARIEVTLALFGGIRDAPVAALTVRGAFEADGAALGAHNADPATGIAIRAGGSLVAGALRLTVPAGASTAGALVSGDAALAALSTDRYFASTFGVDPRTWSHQPAVARVECRTACAGTLAAAVDTAGDNALIWVDGDLHLDGPLVLGSIQRPVVIVVRGALRLDGDVQITGVVYATSLEWRGTTGAAWLRGAAIAETHYRGDGAPDLVYDPAVLATLARNRGSFAVVSGSWRDF